MPHTAVWHYTPTQGHSTAHMQLFGDTDAEHKHAHRQLALASTLHSQVTGLKMSYSTAKGRMREKAGAETETSGSHQDYH